MLNHQIPRDTRPDRAFIDGHASVVPLSELDGRTPIVPVSELDGRTPVVPFDMYTPAVPVLDLTPLADRVAARTTVEQITDTLVAGISAEIKAAGTDPAKLAALTAQLDSFHPRFASTVVAAKAVDVLPPSGYGSSIGVGQGFMVTGATTGTPPFGVLFVAPVAPVNLRSNRHRHPNGRPVTGWHS